MRLLNQRVAQRANREDEAKARMAETLELSDYTSGQRRIAALKTETHTTELNEGAEHRRKLLADSFLAPVDLCESSGQSGPRPSVCGAPPFPHI